MFIEKNYPMFVTLQRNAKAFFLYRPQVQNDKYLGFKLITTETVGKADISATVIDLQGNHLSPIFDNKPDFSEPDQTMLNLLDINAQKLN